MTIRFQCPAGHRLRAPDDRADRTVRCPRCKQTVEVPNPAPSRQAAPVEEAEPVLAASDGARASPRPSRRSDKRPPKRSSKRPPALPPKSKAKPVSQPPEPDPAELPRPVPPKSRAKAPQTADSAEGATPLPPVQAVDAPQPLPPVVPVDASAPEPVAAVDAPAPDPVEPVAPVEKPVEKPSDLPLPVLVKKPPKARPSSDRWSDSSSVWKASATKKPTSETRSKPVDSRHRGRRDRKRRKREDEPAAEPAATEPAATEPVSPPPKPVGEPPKPSKRRRSPPQPKRNTMPADVYVPDTGHVAAVRWLAMFLGLAVAFSLCPIFYPKMQLNLETAPWWARIALLVGVVQIAFIVWMVNRPDWASVWVVMLVFAGVATFYAMASAYALATPIDFPIWGMDDVRHSAKKWCPSVLLVTSLVTYLSGRVSMRWHRALELEHAAARRTRV